MEPADAILTTAGLIGWCGTIPIYVDDDPLQQGHRIIVRRWEDHTLVDDPRVVPYATFVLRTHDLIYQFINIEEVQIARPATFTYSQVLRELIVRLQWWCRTEEPFLIRSDCMKDTPGAQLDLVDDAFERLKLCNYWFLRGPAVLGFHHAKQLVDGQWSSLPWHVIAMIIKYL